MSDLPSPGQDLIGFLIGRTALSEGLSLATVEKVVRYQFRAAAIATQDHNVVEISGLGYLNISEKKVKAKLSRAKRILASYNKTLTQPLSDAKRSNLQKRIDSIVIQIGKYESRLERTSARDV